VTPSESSTASSSLVEKASSSAVEKEKRGFWPTRRSVSKTAASPRIRALSTETPPAAAQPSAGSEAEVSEVLLLLLQGLQRHASWQLESFQVFVRILLDIFLDPSICHHAKSQAAIKETLEIAVKSSAQLVGRVLHGATVGAPEKPGAGGSLDDSLLDLLLEEWEIHKAPLASVSDMCGSPRCLLPPAAPAIHGVTAMRRPPTSSRGQQQGQKTIRSFLLLRRLLMDLAQFMPQVPRERNCVPNVQPWSNVAFNDPMPFQVDEELASDFSENMNIEVGPMERIVCSLATTQGKQTRYLLLHDFWLLLVQPDLTMMGWAVVKTLWPLRSVQSLIDRSDPRTLRLGMNALRGAVGSGEATVSRSAESGGGAGDRPSMYLTLTLNFEDVTRCHSADKHLQKCRQEVRAKLMEKAVAFVDAQS